MRVFLDDVRMPSDKEGYGQDSGWTIVRSYEEFKDLLEESLDDITVISFDHDLGDSDTRTGLDCLKLLIEKDLELEESRVLDMAIRVHSANPPGAENIKSLYQSYVRFRGVR